MFYGLFSNLRFHLVEIEAPSFNDEWDQIATFENKAGDFISEFQKEVGNIREMYHGTGLFNLRNISRDSLLPSTDGMLGAGVYVTPSLTKASFYGKSFHEVDYDGEKKRETFCTILHCHVSLGQVFKTAKVPCRERGEKIEYANSIFCEQGRIQGAWGGNIKNSEYACLDHRQVTVYRIYIYKQKENARKKEEAEKLSSKEQKVLEYMQRHDSIVNFDWKKWPAHRYDFLKKFQDLDEKTYPYLRLATHPCTRGVKICKSSIKNKKGNFGCVRGKKMCQTCPFFES